MYTKGCDNSNTCVESMTRFPGLLDPCIIHVRFIEIEYVPY